MIVKSNHCFCLFILIGFFFLKDRSLLWLTAIIKIHGFTWGGKKLFMMIFFYVGRDRSLAWSFVMSFHLFVIDRWSYLFTFFSLIGFYGEKESDAQDPSSWRPFLHLQPITPRHRLQGPADIRPSLDLLPRPRRNFQLLFFFPTEVTCFHHLHIRWKWKTTF